MAGCLAKQQKSSSQGQSTTVMPRVTEVVLNLIGGYFTQVDFVLIALQFVIIESGNTIPQLLIPLTLMMIAVETSVDQMGNRELAAMIPILYSSSLLRWAIRYHDY